MLDETIGYTLNKIFHRMQNRQKCILIYRSSAKLKKLTKKPFREFELSQILIFMEKWLKIRGQQMLIKGSL